ncbi:hypothetical protein ACVGV7_13475, partial [Enterobacter intestinihominis]
LATGCGGLVFVFKKMNIGVEVGVGATTIKTQFRIVYQKVGVPHGMVAVHHAQLLFNLLG